MLYFRALEFGLAKMPSADAATKQRLQQEIDRLGSAALHQRLAEIDPPSAQRIHPNDPQRIARALEVYELTGQALSDYHRAQSKQILAFQPIKIGLICEQRQQLHQRIEARFLHMMGAGFLDEVAKLYVRPELNVALPSMRSVGYRQLWQHLAGELDYEAAVEKGIVCTRQLAKRQLTWLRSWPRLNLLEAMSTTLMDDAIELLKGTAMGTLAE
jgi:tRNA dimethylallyltransferase